MLSLSMSLDDDLGIDSIKRVEILSELRERLPHVPAAAPDDLGRFRTLADVASFLDGRHDVAAAPATAEPPPGRAPAEPAPTGRPLERRRVEIVPLETRGRPPVELPVEGEILLAGDGTDLSSALAERLRARGLLVREIPGDERPAGLVIVAPTGAGDDAIAAAFRAMREHPPTHLLATVFRLDGSFGFADLDPEIDPTAGGLAGLVKTAIREWPEVAGKAIDLDYRFGDAEEAASAIADEILAAGPVEVGIDRDGRRTLELADVPFSPDRSLGLGARDLVVATGGARGVTADAAVAIARLGGPAFLLLGRSPEPGTEPAELSGIEGEAPLKKALLERAGRPLAPRQLEAEYRKIVAAREIAETLARLESTGSRAIYRSVDVRDPVAVAAAIDEAAAVLGARPAGIVHGAGVLADRRIADKSDEDFDRVYRTKVEGLRAVLEATRRADLRFVALFGSSTGRFGRVGQADYSAGNEVLARYAQRTAKLRPGCRVVCVDWGPWDGGMVTPGLARLFAAEGVGLIPRADGAAYLAREIAQPPGAPIEVVVGATVDAPLPGPERVAFERRIELAATPVLRSHVLGGRAVMPLALSLEWLFHGAIHENPGLVLVGAEDVRVLSPVAIDEDTPADVVVVAGEPRPEGGVLVVESELRRLAAGRSIPCVRARVVLADSRPAAPAPRLVAPSGAYSLDCETSYRERLFHGPDLQAIVAIEGCDRHGIAARVHTAPAPSTWMKKPLRSAWLADPLVLDAAFQLLILWCREVRGAPSLPTGLAALRQHRPFPAVEIRVVARITSAAAGKVAADLEFVDSAGRLVASIDGYECVVDPLLETRFRQELAPAAAQ